MRLATAKILCAVGLGLTCASAFFIATPYDLDGRHAWKLCRKERRIHQSGVYPRSTYCLEREDRFRTGAALMASGLVLIFVARPGSRARKAARARGA